MRVQKTVLIPILTLILILLGSFGFYYIENYHFLDALYMSAITLTTIGYHEVQPLSDTGKIFNLFFISVGLALFTFFMKIIITEITNFDLNKRKEDRMKAKISNLKNHTIICGYGRVGETICQELSYHNIPIVVIEKREQLIEELRDSDQMYIKGDASQDELLIEAGIKSARALVSVIDDDADALYISLAARSLNPNLYIIARASESRARAKLFRAGANKVILPLITSGYKIAECVLNPGVEDLFDITGMENKSDDKDRIQLADLFVTENSLARDRSLIEIGPEMGSIIVVGIKNEEGAFKFRPKTDYRFQAGDCIITLGPRSAYNDFKKNFKLSYHPNEAQS